VTEGDLQPYGWDGEWASAFDAIATAGDRAARVTTVRRVNCDVVTADGNETVRPSPRLSERPDGATLPAVGDWVVLSDEEDTPEPAIVAILPRRGVISRLDPADITQEQVLAANVDVLVITQALDREVSLGRIDRSVVLAMQAHADPVVALTKGDLAADPDAEAEVVARAVEPVGAEVVVTSTVTGEGIERIAELALPHRTLALLGPSGAGKSTLANALLGAEVMDTGEVRAGDAKGRHTTVTRELLVLPRGGLLIDTPGLRGLGLWSADLGVDLAFPDVFALTEQCRFADCTHDHEPGCAVVAAVEAGELDARRVESYRRLVDELADVDRRREEQERQRGEKGWKSRGERTGKRVSGRRRR
jgi:ribosome biogenesis GTPase